MDFVERLSRELSSKDAVQRLTGYSAYTGASFERYGRPGSDIEITGDDLIAVTMLSMSVGRREKAGMSPSRLLRMEDQSERIGDLLQWIPMNHDLCMVSEREFEQLFGVHGHVRSLFHLLANELELGNVAAHKILARKRPRLIPIRDSRAESVLGKPNGWWQSWWEAMKLEEIVNQTDELRRKADCPQYSLLRTADIVVWMKREIGTNDEDEVDDVGEG